MNAHTDDFAEAARVCLDDLNMQAWRQYMADQYRQQSIDSRVRAHRALRRGYVGEFRHCIRTAIREWSMHKHYARKAAE